MAMKTAYGVQPFENAPRGRSRVLQVVPANSAAEALRRAERLATEKGGALAFSRDIDTEFGDFDEPVILGRFGDVPREFER